VVTLFAGFFISVSVEEGDDNSLYIVVLIARVLPKAILACIHYHRDCQYFYIIKILEYISSM